MSRELYERPEKWDWVPTLSDRTRNRVARTVLELIQQGPRWVHRRVETVTFIDETIARRHLTIDFTLPKRMPSPLTTTGGDPIYFVPLTLLYRQPRKPRTRVPMHYDVRNESGEALSLLTDDEQSRIAVAMLLQLVADTARKERYPVRVDDGLAGALTAVATREYEDALPALRAILNPQSPEWRDLPAHRGLRHVLWRDAEFADFVSLVAGHSVAITPLIGSPGRRRVLKFTYEEPVDDGPPEGKLSRRARLLAWTNYRAQSPRLRAPLVGGAETHHFQITVPRDVLMTSAIAAGAAPRVVVADGVFDEGDRRPVNHRGARTYVEQERGSVVRVDLKLENCKRTTTGGLWVGLRAERRSWLLGALLASLFIAAALWSAVAMDDTLVNQAGSATSILLVVPGLTAVYMARPGEHPLATRLLRFPRIVLAISGFCSFLAAGALLLLGPTPAEVSRGEGLGSLLPGWLARGDSDLASSPGLFATLVGLVVIATLAAIALAAAYWLPRAKR